MVASQDEYARRTAVAEDERRAAESERDAAETSAELITSDAEAELARAYEAAVEPASVGMDEDQIVHVSAADNLATSPGQLIVLDDDGLDIVRDAARARAAERDDDGQDGQGLSVCTRQCPPSNSE